MSADVGDDHLTSTPLWVRSPARVHQLAYAAAALVFTGQIVAVLARGSSAGTVLAVLAAGLGVALSWWRPWAGLVVTSASSFAVTAVGQDPLSVWMMAVLVLFSFAFRGKPVVVGTAIVAGFFLAAYMTVGGFTGGAVVGCAAVFSAIGGGATGAALRIHREHWLVLEQRARAAVATREVEVGRRVTEERLRIARDLHDVVGHQVAMLSVYLGVAEIGLPREATSSREALESARSSARSIVEETQRILSLLRRGSAVPDAEALQPTPSLTGLDSLIASFESIGLVVDADIQVGSDSLEPSTGIAVYRIVQEALTNAYQHGEGSVDVTVTVQGDRATVMAENDVAHSREGSVRSGGLGLVGMRERAESSGGGLSITTVDDRFRVVAEINRRRSVPV